MSATEKQNKSEWLPVQVILESPQFHSSPMRIIPVLVCIPYRATAAIGWYFSEMKEWRIDGSPSKQFVTHWMPLPPLPEPTK